MNQKKRKKPKNEDKNQSIRKSENRRQEPKYKETLWFINFEINQLYHFTSNPQGYSTTRSSNKVVSVGCYITSLKL